MKRVIYSGCFCVLVIMSSFVGSSFGKDNLPISCSPDRPVVRRGEAIMLRVWADRGQQNTLTYEWEVSAGKVQGKGSDARWDFAGVQPGTYTATAFVAYPTGETEKCTVQILVEQPEAEARGGITGWSLLLSGAREKSGYGLYSYILFGSRPTDATRAASNPASAAGASHPRRRRPWAPIRETRARCRSGPTLAPLSREQARENRNT